MTEELELVMNRTLREMGGTFTSNEFIERARKYGLLQSHCNNSLPRNFLLKEAGVVNKSTKIWVKEFKGFNPQNKAISLFDKIEDHVIDNGDSQKEIDAVRFLRSIDNGMKYFIRKRQVNYVEEK